MPKQSAGILLYKISEEVLYIFLVHPGGPYYRNKDAGSWSIPKGECYDGEALLITAKREFEEETGQVITGNFIKLPPVKQKSGKTVHAWAVAGDIDHENIVSNVFEIEWPPKSGKMVTFPEIDKAAWFTSVTAKLKLIAAQATLIDELERIIKAAS